VVVKPNQVCTEEALHEFAAQRLAKFKLPKKYVLSSEPLPKGGTGKILKRELREPFWQGKDRRVQG
jgi:acyl-CoA synthetase (AMP-forming)/AMP-acid ligase II